MFSLHCVWDCYTINQTKFPIILAYSVTWIPTINLCVFRSLVTQFKCSHVSCILFTAHQQPAGRGASTDSLTTPPASIASTQSKSLFLSLCPDHSVSIPQFPISLRHSNPLTATPMKPSQNNLLVLQRMKIKTMSSRGPGNQSRRHGLSSLPMYTLEHNKPLSQQS